MARAFKRWCRVDVSQQTKLTATAWTHCPSQHWVMLVFLLSGAGAQMTGIYICLYICEDSHPGERIWKLNCGNWQLDFWVFSSLPVDCKSRCFAWDACVLPSSCPFPPMSQNKKTAQNKTSFQEPLWAYVNYTTVQLEDLFSRLQLRTPHTHCYVWKGIFIKGLCCLWP